MIDTEKYILSDNNFINVETIKKQIVFTHSGTKGMSHFNKWSTRLNGTYKKTAAFSIDVDGNIYQHFDPIYFSTMFNSLEIDKKSIVIHLENDGWLTKTDKGEFINWIGHIYERPDDVVEQNWRNYTYWAPYTDKQFESAIYLASKLCDEFYIRKVAIPHNTKVDKLDNFSGVLYRSNFERHFTDLNPSWKFEEFSNKLENI